MYYATVPDCVKSGAHLTSCDADGFCNNCGHQDLFTISQLAEVYAHDLFEETPEGYATWECRLCQEILVWKNAESHVQTYHRRSNVSAAFAPVSVGGNINWLYCTRYANFVHRDEDACEFILHIGDPNEDTPAIFSSTVEKMERFGCTPDFIKAYKDAKEAGATRVLFWV